MPVESKNSMNAVNLYLRFLFDFFPFDVAPYVHVIAQVGLQQFKLFKGVVWAFYAILSYRTN